jgi:hypothetical protein
MEKESYVGKTYTYGAARLLIVEEPVKNSIKCTCDICGAVDTYKLSDLRELKVDGCKTCKQGLKVGDKKGDMEILEFLLRDGKVHAKLRCTECNTLYVHSIKDVKSSDCKCVACERRAVERRIYEVKPNSIINGMEVLERVNYNNKPHFKVRCTKCGKQFLHSVQATLAPDYGCPVCNKNTAKKADQQDIKGKEKTKKEATKKNLLGNIASFDKEPVLDLTKFRIAGDFIFTGTATRTSLTGVSVSTLVKGQCTHCGSITMDTEGNFSKNNYKCKKCSKISSDKRNIIENTNWVGYVRHNIEVTKVKKNSDGVLMADTKCLACGHEMTIPVTTIMSEPELTCIKCGDTPILVECPLCHKNHIKTTLRKIYEKRDYTAGILCGKDTVLYSEIALQHETATRLENIRKRYKGYTLEERIPGHDETPVIFKFQEHYTGTDNNIYHTCMCEVHNKLMVLTDDEIRVYKHEYCADTRMMPYNPNKKPKK